MVSGIRRRTYHEQKFACEEKERFSQVIFQEMQASFEKFCQILPPQQQQLNVRVPMQPWSEHSSLSTTQTPPLSLSTPLLLQQK